MVTHPVHLVALADDDADDRELFTEVCADINVDLEVILFEDGRQLLDYLEAGEALLPSILFLDINMPVKNGFESLGEIRSNPDFNDLCIIMYSTSMSGADVAKARKMGADGFLRKATSYTELKSSVRKILDTDWRDPCAQLDEMNFLISAG